MRWRCLSLLRAGTLWSSAHQLSSGFSVKKSSQFAIDGYRNWFSMSYWRISIGIRGCLEIAAIYWSTSVSIALSHSTRNNYTNRLLSIEITVILAYCNCEATVPLLCPRDSSFSCRRRFPGCGRPGTAAWSAHPLSQSLRSEENIDWLFVQQEWKKKLTVKLSKSTPNWAHVSQTNPVRVKFQSYSNNSWV